MGDPSVAADPALHGKKAGSESGIFKVDRFAKPQDYPGWFKKVKTEHNLNPRMLAAMAIFGAGLMGYYAYQSHADEVTRIDRARELNRTDKKKWNTNAPDATN